MTMKKRRHKATKLMRKSTGLDMATSAKLVRMLQGYVGPYDPLPGKAKGHYDYYSNGCSCCEPYPYKLDSISGPKGEVYVSDIQDLLR